MTPKDNDDSALFDADCAYKIEEKEINIQRAARLKDSGHQTLQHAPVGLALSGGGIRSATLALGVLQWLCKPLGEKTPGKESCDKKPPGQKGDLPLIEYVDYLSTVSGGGYMGSWFVANRRREAEAIANQEEDENKKPIAPNDFINRKDSPWLWHLRRYSRYLAPEGGLMSADTWTAVVIWFRNTVLIQALVFSVVAFAFLLARCWGLAVMDWAPTFPVGFRGEGGPFVWPVIGLLALAAVMVGIELRRFDADDKKVAQAEPENAQSDTKTVLARVRSLKSWLLKKLLNPDEAMRQGWVQKLIVLPTIATGFFLTLGMWWRNTAVQESGDPVEMASASWGSAEWFKQWSDGDRVEWVYQDPALWGMCLVIGLLAFGLLHYGQKRSERSGLGSRFLVLITVTLMNMALCHGLDQLFGALKGFEVSAQTLGLVADASPAEKAVEACCDGKQAEGLNVSIGFNLDIHVAKPKPPGVPLGGAVAAVLGPTLAIFSYALVVIVGIGMMGRQMPDKVREWWSRLGAWLIIYSLALLVLTGLAIFGPLLVDGIRKAVGGWFSSGLLSSWLVATVSSVFLGKSQKTSGVKDSSKLGLLLNVLTFVAVTGLLIGCAWLLRFMLTPNLDSTPIDPFLNDGLFSQSRHWSVGAALFVAGILLSWRVDLNEFSMNQFYRNRLVRCYLGGARKFKDRTYHPFTSFDFKDDLPLHAFRQGHEQSRHFKGPYPLVCAALNTAKGGDLDVQERKAESFLFSPLFTGFSRRRIDYQDNKQYVQGYRATKDYMIGDLKVDEKKPFFEDPSLSLGTVVSISGAAASPNSGYHTSPLMAFLLTIFNARLGAWVSNPVMSRWWDNLTGVLEGVKYMSFELFGSASLNSSRVYVSDGGHFENLGLYELIRRRCRFIIVVDGEQDGAYSFHALGTAIRRCRVDFDAEIQINVSDIKPSPSSGWSISHGAVGKIIYHGERKKQAAQKKKSEMDLDDNDGVIIYLKSSLTGDEGTDVHQYKSLNPVFPHESTGDQFFSESQFESYRELGYHIAREMFGAALKRRTNGGGPNGGGPNGGGPNGGGPNGGGPNGGGPNGGGPNGGGPNGGGPNGGGPKTGGATGSTDLIRFLRTEMYERWFQPARAAAGAFVLHTDALDELWAELCRPDMPACLTDLMMTNWEGFQTSVATGATEKANQNQNDPSSEASKSQEAKLPETAEERSIVYAFCQRLIQLMENVYLDLHLDADGDHMDNLGWMNLFRHWVSRPVMKAAWENSQKTYGKRFRKFWEDLECSAGEVEDDAGSKATQPYLPDSTTDGVTEGVPPPSGE